MYIQLESLVADRLPSFAENVLYKQSIKLFIWNWTIM